MITLKTDTSSLGKVAPVAGSMRSDPASEGIYGKMKLAPLPRTYPCSVHTSCPARTAEGQRCTERGAWSVLPGCPGLATSKGATMLVQCDVIRDGQLVAEQGEHTAAEGFDLGQNRVKDEPQSQHQSDYRIGVLRLIAWYGPVRDLPASECSFVEPEPRLPHCHSLI